MFVSRGKPLAKVLKEKRATLAAKDTASAVLMVVSILLLFNSIFINIIYSRPPAS